MPFHRITSVALCLALTGLLGACQSSRDSRRFTRDEMSAQLRKLEAVSLDLGEFPIEGASAVVDGDTLHVNGLQSALRLLGLDTEETFKHDDERKAYAAGWDSYREKMRGISPRPVKMATPMGEEAKVWAEAFFEGVSSVKLERDHPGEIRDYYGRYLTYVMVQKNGRWLNYNIECVRAGYSPYFTKYGRSRRFHREFLEAQRNAQAAKIGIWSPGKLHYADYDERLKWWNDRESAITRFEKQMEESPEEYVALTRWDALTKLEGKVGQPVVLLGAVSEVHLAEKGPSVVKLSRTRGSDFDIVFFDKSVMMASGVLFKQGEYVQVRGVVTKFRPRQFGRERLQLVVTLPGQVLAPSAELEQLLAKEHPDSAGIRSLEGE